jgi:hypothetical protein
MAAAGDPEPREPREEVRQERLRILDLSAVGLVFPVAMLIGYFGGRVVGGWLGSAQLGGLVGSLLGIAGGFYNLFKMVSRLAPRRTATAPGGVGGSDPGSGGAVRPEARTVAPIADEDMDAESARDLDEEEL